MSNYNSWLAFFFLKKKKEKQGIPTYQHDAIPTLRIIPQSNSPVVATQVNGTAQLAAKPWNKDKKVL
jgi:hypothetical protein